MKRTRTESEKKDEQKNECQNWASIQFGDKTHKDKAQIKIRNTMSYKKQKHKSVSGDS